jgi:hypothetical protein
MWSFDECTTMHDGKVHVALPKQQKHKRHWVTKGFFHLLNFKVDVLKTGHPQWAPWRLPQQLPPNEHKTKHFDSAMIIWRGFYEQWEVYMDEQNWDFLKSNSWYFCFKKDAT